MERTRCRRAELDQTKEPEALTSEELRKRWGSGNYQAYYEVGTHYFVSSFLLDFYMINVYNKLINTDLTAF